MRRPHLCHQRVLRGRIVLKVPLDVQHQDRCVPHLRKMHPAEGRRVRSGEGQSRGGQKRAGRSLSAALQQPPLVLRVELLQVPQGHVALLRPRPAPQPLQASLRSKAPRVAPAPPRGSPGPSLLLIPPSHLRGGAEIEEAVRGGVRAQLPHEERVPLLVDGPLQGVQLPALEQALGEDVPAGEGERGLTHPQRLRTRTGSPPAPHLSLYTERSDTRTGPSGRSSCACRRPRHEKVWKVKAQRAGSRYSRCRRLPPCGEGAALSRVSAPTRGSPRTAAAHLRRSRHHLPPARHRLRRPLPRGEGAAQQPQERRFAHGCGRSAEVTRGTRAPPPPRLAPPAARYRCCPPAPGAARRRSAPSQRRRSRCRRARAPCK